MVKIRRVPSGDQQGDAFTSSEWVLRDTPRPKALLT